MISSLLHRLRTLGLLALITGLLSACAGWTVSSRPDEVHAGPARISIGVIQNQVTPPRPGLEYRFSERFKEEIALDSRFELAGYKSGTRIDVVLIQFDEPDLVRNFDNTKSEIAANARALIRIYEPSSVREESVRAYQSYAPALEKDTRNDGLNRLWRDLSRKMLDAIAGQEWGRGSNTPNQ